MRDGRAVLRIDGKRYERQPVRVSDPEFVTALRLQLEEMARQRGRRNRWSGLRERAL